MTVMERSFMLSKSFNEREMGTLKRELAVLDIFSDLQETMPIQFMKTFMLVALNEGKTVAWYANKLGYQGALMSRHLQDLGDVNRYHDEGFGLIERYGDVYDRRYVLIRLSPKGRSFASRIIRTLEP